MSFFQSSTNFNGRSFSELTPTSADLIFRRTEQAVDFNVRLEMLALFLAKTWKDDHPGATAASEDDLNQCILAVTRELAIAAQAVGGPIGLEVLTGGGSAAARAVCKQVLSGDCD